MRSGLALFCVVATAHVSSACSIPVFRYALELWPASPYELLLFHDGPLGDDERNALRRIRRETSSANLKITQIDRRDGMTDDQRRILERDGKGAIGSWFVLRFPDSGQQVASAWSGSVAAAEKLSLADSPARRAIFERLTAGNAAVILLLLSGDERADDAARRSLQKHVSQIAAKMELPAQTEEGPQIQSSLPLYVRFPVLEIRRDSVEELLLVRILLGSEDGLDRVRGPIAFPVFGRGRALCAWHGSDLDAPAELHRALDFLCRACTCQAKELNPGLDLLIAGRWDVIFAAESGPAPRTVATASVPGAETKPSRFNDPAWAELRSAPPPDYTAVEVTGREPSTRRPPWLRLGLVAAGLSVLVTGFWLIRSRRAASATPS